MVLFSEKVTEQHCTTCHLKKSINSQKSLEGHISNSSLDTKIIGVFFSFKVHFPLHTYDLYYKSLNCKVSFEVGVRLELNNRRHIDMLVSLRPTTHLHGLYSMSTLVLNCHYC